MIILCSDLANDQDMIKALGNDAYPLPLFTDACFTGVEGLVVACERKKIGDMVSCVQTGRFLNQVTTCKENNADVLILILEGTYRRNPEDGSLEVPVWRINPRTGKRAEFWDPVRPFIQFSRFSQYLWELSYLVGVHVLRSDNVRGTADLILTLADWSQRPKHHSLEQFYVAPPSPVPLTRPSLLRRVVKELPLVGWTRSGEVVKHFHSVREMVDADIKEWSTIPGIGKKTAESVVKALQGE